MVPQASPKCVRLLNPQCITSCTNNNLNSEQVPGTCSVLRMSSICQRGISTKRESDRPVFALAIGSDLFNKRNILVSKKSASATSGIVSVSEIEE